MSIESKRKLECLAIDCKYFEMHCLVFHGNNCIRIDGDRIPVQRSFSKGIYPPQKPSLVKPHFGTIDGWKIEDILNLEG